MILDASALVAIFLGEPDAERLLQAIGDAPIIAVGAPTLVEAAIVLSSRLGRDARPQLGEFLREAEVEIVPFTADHYEVALDAFRRFGQGRHPAALNFGDCFAYACARHERVPLLYKGDDFSQTDIETA